MKSLDTRQDAQYFLESPASTLTPLSTSDELAGPLTLFNHLSYKCVYLANSDYLFLSPGDIVKQRKKLKTPRSNEYKIKRLILRHYDKTTRPVHDDRTPCRVNVAISLYHILDTVSD